MAAGASSRGIIMAVAPGSATAPEDGQPMTDDRPSPVSPGSTRRVHHSDPNAWPPALLSAEFDRLARRLYVGVRDGAVDCEAAFDLATFLMDWAPADPVLQDLATVALEGTDQERLALLSRWALADRFQPGFDLEPGWLATLEEALGTVTLDMRSTGLPGPVRLVIPEWSDPPHAYVEYQGIYGSGSGMAPAAGQDPRRALLAVADAAQDSVMEALWEAWPVCPSHQLGMHVQEDEDVPAWSCKGGGGHAITVGNWPGP
jgi:hypothetical protein